MKAKPSDNLIVCKDSVALAEEAARRFIASAQNAIAERGRFVACLAGGSTPRALYQSLARPEHTGAVDWARIELFWGDERCVPPDDAQSNFRMARETLLDRVPVPSERIHRIQGELGAQAAASAYDREIGKVLGADPVFDLVLLGLGDDGHTASLFPGGGALDVFDRRAVAVEHHTPPEPLVDRVTLTFPVLNAARQIMFMVAGKAKAERLREVLSVEKNPPRLPAQGIHPTHGELIWLVDEAAAGPP